jgi:hypothetical protein
LNEDADPGTKPDGVVVSDHRVQAIAGHGELGGHHARRSTRLVAVAAGDLGYLARYELDESVGGRLAHDEGQMLGQDHPLVVPAGPLASLLEAPGQTLVQQRVVELHDRQLDRL